MTRDRDFKKVVRVRMDKTGESYTTARAKLRPRPDARTGMYPFDMFDDSAKDVLAGAQADAFKSQSGMILPQHLLLSLLRVRKGGGARVLRRLGVRAPALRAALKLHPSRVLHHPAGRIIPAAETKRVIDEALRWAGDHGSERVRSEHLLAGLFCEASDPACLALADLGVTAERTAAYIAELDRPESQPSTRRPPAPQPVPHPAATGGLQAAIQQARDAAQREGAMFFRSDHLLSRLVAADTPTPALAHLLVAVGVDLDHLRRRLRPPRRVVRLEAEIWKLRHQEDDAIRDGDEGRARRLLEAEAKLRNQLEAALDAWNQSWTRPVKAC